MALAHITEHGFYVRSEEADTIEGEGTFTPLPEFDPKTQVPRYLGGSDWSVLPISARDDFRPPEPPEPPTPVVVLYPADLWRRTTDGEAEAIEGAMAQQPVRLRNLFRSAQTYQSDDPLWPILTAAATQLFGADRAAELLAASA